MWGASFPSLPTWLGSFTELSYLSIQELGLSELPDCLRELTKLESLSCNGNQTSRIPDWIGNLTRLETLEISHNQIAELPRQLASLLKGGLDLRLDGNPLRAPPPGADPWRSALVAVIRTRGAPAASLLTAGRDNCREPGVIMGRG